MTIQIMPRIRQIEKPHQNNGRKKTSSELLAPALPQVAQKDATYKSALELVARIDEDLTRGMRHYRTKAGELLITLDQVVTAILDNELLEPEGVA